MCRLKNQSNLAHSNPEENRHPLGKTIHPDDIFRTGHHLRIFRPSQVQTSAYNYRFCRKDRIWGRREECQKFNPNRHSVQIRWPSSRNAEDADTSHSSHRPGWRNRRWSKTSPAGRRSTSYSARKGWRSSVAAPPTSNSVKKRWGPATRQHMPSEHLALCVHCVTDTRSSRGTHLRNLPAKACLRPDAEPFYRHA